MRTVLLAVAGVALFVIGTGAAARVDAFARVVDLDGKASPFCERKPDHPRCSTVTTGTTMSTTATTEPPVTTSPPTTTTSPPTTTTTEPPVESGWLGTSSHTLAASVMAHIKATSGATWYRDDALWETIEPTQGVRNWSRLDSLFANARSAGVNVLLIVDYAPAWAGVDPTLYARFAADVATRYAGFGGQLALELWNEPYMPTTYRAPATYAAMVRAAADAVHQLGLGVPVGANVDLRDYKNGGSPYFAAMLDSDPELGGVVDFWSAHPYAGNCAPTATDATCPELGQDWRFDRVPKMQALAESRGAAAPWWLTEFGWSTNTGGVSPDVQAAYTVDAIRLARDQWGVERGFVYTGDCDGSSTSDRESNFGMRFVTCADKPVMAAVADA